MNTTSLTLPRERPAFRGRRHDLVREPDAVCGELDYVAKSAESRGSMGADGKDRHIVERPTGTRGRPPARCRHASVACNGTRNQSGHRRTFAGLSPSSPDPPRRSDSLSQGDTCPNHARIVLMSTPVRRRWTAVAWRMAGTAVRRGGIAWMVAACSTSSGACRAMNRNSECSAVRRRFRVEVALPRTCSR